MTVCLKVACSGFARFGLIRLLTSLSLLPRLFKKLLSLTFKTFRGEPIQLPLRQTLANLALVSTLKLSVKPRSLLKNRELKPPKIPTTGRTVSLTGLVQSGPKIGRLVKVIL